MTLDEFIEKTYGKKVDFDGLYGSHCVDLFRQYCKEVLNIPHTGGVVGASELYSKYEEMPKEKKYFERIKNYPWTVPRAGDVVVFNSTGNNRFGHVAIVVSATVREMKVFQQDGFNQSRGAHFKTLGYKNVLGFLRKKEV